MLLILRKKSGNTVGFEWLNSQIAEKCIEVVLVFDEKGNILYGNKAALDKLEYSKEELLNCNMVQIFK